MLKARLHVAGLGNGKGNNEDESAASVRHIEYAPVPKTLTLTPAKASGITPLDVTFAAGVDTPSAVTRFEIDYDGNGTWDRTETSIPDELANRYAAPGLRLATARVTMNDGSVHTATSLIHAQSFRTMNTLLKSVWTGFRDDLAIGNVEAAMTWFAADSVREKYRRPLETIRQSPPSFAAGIQTLDAVWIRGDVARYLAARVENGRPTGYHVYFARDASGTWKILQF